MDEQRGPACVQHTAGRLARSAAGWGLGAPLMWPMRNHVHAERLGYLVAAACQHNMQGTPPMRLMRKPRRSRRSKPISSSSSISSSGVKRARCFLRSRSDSTCARHVCRRTHTQIDAHLPTPVMHAPLPPVLHHLPQPGSFLHVHKKMHTHTHTYKHTQA